MALLIGALAIIALVLSGSFETLIAISSFLVVSVYISGFAALFRLRAQRPELTRPFKMWGYPWTTLGVLLASLGFLMASVIGDIKHSLFRLVLIAVSYPVYLLAVKKRAAHPHRDCLRATTVSCAKCDVQIGSARVPPHPLRGYVPRGTLILRVTGLSHGRGQL